MGRAKRHRWHGRSTPQPSQGFGPAPAVLICVLCVICGSKSCLRDGTAPALTAKQAVKQLEPQRTQKTQMAAELIRPTDARFDALWAAPTAAPPPIRHSNPMASLPPGGEPMAMRATRPRPVGSRRPRMVRDGGRPRNAKFVQGPFFADEIRSLHAASRTDFAKQPSWPRNSVI